MRLPNWPQQRTRRGLSGHDDISSLRRLARWCRRYSPIVGLEEAEAPEAILLDVTGCAHLFRGEERLGRCVVRELARAGLIADVAIADTIGAAWAAAFCAVRRNNQSPVVIAPGEHTSALESLPIEALRLPDVVVATLLEFDLRTIGQVQRLPRETLPSRFGAEILLRLDQATGLVPEMIVPERPDEPLEERWGSEEPIDNRLAIEAVLKGLTDRVVDQAAGRGLGVERLDISLTCPVRELFGLSIRCLRPTLHREHLHELVRLQLDRLQLAHGIVDFTVRATVIAVLDESQPDLFGDVEQRNGQRELDRLLNRLTSRLGRTSVLSPVLRADHQPEHVADFQPVCDLPRTGTNETTFPGRCRPVRMRSPVPVAVTSLVPDGPPIRFRWQGVDHRIVWHDGPERIETGWWRGFIRRDYYPVETDSGQRYWLFRALDDGRWFLHGEF